MMRGQGQAKAGRSRILVVLGSLVFLTVAGAAQAGSTQDEALGRSLFDQARALMDKGKHAEACPKLEESQRLAPGIGTLFNLAHCYEEIGKTASAWSMFLDVAAQAKNANQKEREQTARARAKALESRVPHVVVVVAPDAEVPGLEVKRDTTVLGKALWGTSMPTDPGTHTITASAPGKKRWSQEINVQLGASPTSVTIPALETESGSTVPPKTVSVDSPAVAADTDAEGNKGSSQRWIGLGVAGVGLIGVGVGSVLALSAKSRYKEAAPYCSDGYCDQAGQDIHDEARSRGNVASIVAGVGIAAIAGGVVLYLTAPKKPATAPAGRPSTWLVAGPNTLGLGGKW